MFCMPICFTANGHVLILIKLTNFFIKMALSTLAVAVHNTQCQIPFFVQVMERNKSMYMGVLSGGGIRTDFQMVVLSRKPPHCGHLSGLLSMFKGKINSGSLVDIPSIRVTAR